MGEGFSIAVPVLVGVAIGIKLDGWLHTAPIFTLLLMLLGVAAGVWGMIRRHPPRGPKP